MGKDRRRRALIIVAVGGLMAAPSRGEPGEAVVTPREVIPGGIARVIVRGECQGAEGNVGDQVLHFFRPGSGGAAVALIGVDLDAPQGERAVEVRCKDWEGRASLRIREHTFPRQELTVAKRYVEPDPAEQARAAREAKRLKRLWATVSPQRLWDGKFQRPTGGPLGSAFGLRRIFNGQPRSPHSGVDIRAPRGTPVVAANRGRVVLRDQLFFSGNTVALDHGLGLYTSYLHLSEFRVSEGDIVEKGQVIGRVGATGRATGAHLHFSARLAGARVEPWQLITDDFETGTAQAGGTDGSAAEASLARAIGSAGTHTASGRDKGVVR